MAGIRGNTAYIAMGRNASSGAKGSPATQPKHMWPFSGGGISPEKTIAKLQETDDRRDAGVSYVSAMSVAGTPEVYGRDNNIDTILGAGMGAVVDSGTMPNFTHTITPAAALPYMTAWKMIGDTLFEKYDDVFVNEITLRADAGGPLTVAFSLMGLTTTRLTTDPQSGWTAPAVTLENGPVYTFNNATLTLAGASTRLISSFEMTISNNVSAQQTDDVVMYDLVPGTFEVGLSFDLIFETLSEYNRFYYGSTSGTAPSPILGATDFAISFDNGANNQIQLSIPSFAYEEFPVDPQPDGSPVVSSVRGSAQRQAPGTAMITAIVKNQKAVSF